MLIKKTSFTVFDFETTGLYPYAGDKICEIGAIRVDPDKRIKKRFHSMVDPERHISYGAYLVNNITEDMVRGAPKICQVLPGFMKFIEGSALVAYNAGFDIGFLECALAEAGQAVLKRYHVIDALKLARRLFPGLARYNLGSVSNFLGVRALREHRAVADASMTLKVFERELELLSEKGVRTIEGITRISATRASRISTLDDYKTELIKKAIDAQEKLCITYRSSWNNKLTQRTISPQALQAGYDRSYVVAYCHLKKAKRNFRLDGIVEAKPEGPTARRL